MERQGLRLIHLPHGTTEALSGLVTSASGRVNIFDPIQEMQTVITLMRPEELSPIPNAPQELLQELIADRKRLGGRNIGISVQVQTGSLHILELWYPITIQAAAQNVIALTEFYGKMIQELRATDEDTI